MVRILYYWDGRWFSTGHVSTYYASDATILDQIKSDIKRNLAWWTNASEHLTWSVLYGNMDAPELFNVKREDL